MATYTQIFWQLVYSTKNRNPILLKENRPALFKYISGILRNKNCFLYQINGVEDHIHIFTHIHPSIAVADLVKDIKQSTNKYIKNKGIFPGFTNWQKGYGAFTYSVREKQKLINYVKHQEEHHKSISFIDEYKHLLIENEIEFDEKYLL